MSQSFLTAAAINLEPAGRNFANVPPKARFAPTSRGHLSGIYSTLSYTFVSRCRSIAMSFFDTVDNMLHTRSPLRAHFTIPAGQILDAAADSAIFQPHASYFEIRLSQMYLRDQREYWREFVPLASFVSELLFDGQRREVPFVVGPDRLGSAEKISKGNRVQYFNTRIAGRTRTRVTTFLCLQACCAQPLAIGREEHFRF
jgi:hypothetical protein